MWEAGCWLTLKQQTCQNCSGVRTAGILVIYLHYTKACDILSPLPHPSFKITQFCHFPSALIHSYQIRYASSPFSGHIVTHILILCLPDELLSSLVLLDFQNPETQHNVLSTGSIVTILSGWPSVNAHFRPIIACSSVSQPLWDRGPVNPLFIRRGPGPNKLIVSNFPFF